MLVLEILLPLVRGERALEARLLAEAGKQRGRGQGALDGGDVGAVVDEEPEPAVDALLLFVRPERFAKPEGIETAGHRRAAGAGVEIGVAVLLLGDADEGRCGLVGDDGVDCGPASFASVRSKLRDVSMGRVQWIVNFLGE